MIVNETALQGMKEITQFLGRSEATVVALKKQHPDMPIRKIAGRWESDKILLAEWRRGVLLTG